MSHVISHPIPARARLRWLFLPAAVAATAGACHLLTGLGGGASAMTSAASLTCTLGALSTEYGAAGARVRFYGAGLAVAGLVTAVAGGLDGGGCAVVYVASFAVGAGLGAIVGDALSGVRPMGEALRLGASTLATVGVHLALPALAYALSA